MRLRLERRDSPLGAMLLLTDDEGALRGLDFADHETRLRTLLRQQNGAHEIEDGDAPAGVARALDRYFEGAFEALDDVPVATGGTAFQRSVWAALRDSGGHDNQLRRPGGAVGASESEPSGGDGEWREPGVDRDPLPPGYWRERGVDRYGGGLPRKRWLIDHERRSG